MPTLKVNEIIAYSGNTLSLGTSGNTITIPANTTFNALSGNVYIPNGIIKLDSITASATATYNLTYGGSAYSPASATACLVSVNGVLQTPGTAFTISGSQITFSSALNPTDVINFIIVLAAPYTLNAPGDGTVTNASVASNAAIATTKLGTGAVLQVVQQVYDTFGQTNSQTYTDTGLTLAITPSSTSNKILVIASINYGTNTASAQTISNDLLRSASSIRTFETVLQAGAAISGQISYTYLDSPSTTSSTTYKIQYKGSAGTGQYVRINNYAGGSTSSASTLTLIEIKG